MSAQIPGKVVKVGLEDWYSSLSDMDRIKISRYVDKANDSSAFSLILSLPFSARELVSADYAAIPHNVIWEIAFLIFFATFVAYFLIPYGQKRIRPTLVSMYSYLQPIIATVISIITGLDILTWQKLVATLLVFSGVYLVIRSRAAA